MNRPYKKIKGLGTGSMGLQIGVRTRLYAGDDHLLLVESTGYTEEYKRCFYRDVRYVVAQRTNAQIIQGVISGGLFLATSLLILTPIPRVIAFGLLLPWVIWFFLNILRGPSCRTYISTNVQTIKLPTPRRLGKVPVLVTFLNEKLPAGQAPVGQAVT